MKHIRISGYEWDLLESRGYVCGLTQSQWHAYFLSISDYRNLEMLETFYKPYNRENIFKGNYNQVIAHNIKLHTDNRLLEYIATKPNEIQSLTSREFEHLIAELLEKMGYYNIELCKGSKDHGVDIIGYIEHTLGIERIIVQCKKYSPSNKVKESTIKQLLTDVELQKAIRGIVVTTSTLTKPARLLVDSYIYKLSVVEGNQLTEFIKKYG